MTDEAVLEVKEDAKKGDIKRAFSKFNKNKLQNRVVVRLPCSCHCELLWLVRVGQLIESPLCCCKT